VKQEKGRKRSTGHSHSPTTLEESHKNRTSGAAFTAAEAEAAVDELDFSGYMRRGAARTGRRKKKSRKHSKKKKSKKRTKKRNSKKSRRRRRR
jgi:hypothetical protein